MSTLHRNLNSALITRTALGQGWEQVRDIIPRMSVQAGAQSLLVQEMCNQTDTAAEDEETVEDTHAEVVFRLFRRESTAVAEQIDEADGDTAVDVEDQIVFL